MFARTARTAVEKRAAAQRARPSLLSNVDCSALRSSRRTLVSSASIFSQRASSARTDTANEFTTAFCWKEAQLTYIVNESCIKCKYMDCVEVCPVDCFYEGENMLVIHPDECIDCGVCEPECPVDAIKPDSEPGFEKWLDINAKYSLVWPNITVKREPPPDAKDWEGKPDKVNLLSPNPGIGD